MIETMYAAPGIGLAAPQVGVGLRIFVADVSAGRNPADLLTFINPAFVDARRQAARGRRLPERARLQRHRCAAPRASCSKGLARDGSEQVIEGAGLLARCFEHEMDHLDGTLFVDRLRGLQKDLIVRKIKKLSRKAGKW